MNQKQDDIIPLEERMRNEKIPKGAFLVERSGIVYNISDLFSVGDNDGKRYDPRRGARSGDQQT